MLRCRKPLRIAYISDQIKEKQSAQIAAEVRKAIAKTIKSLAHFPESHEKEHYLCDDQQIYRRVLQWDFRIIFSIDYEELMVAVVEVVHSSRSKEVTIKKIKG